MTKCAVVGTRGVPARYGGFETLVEHLARNIGSDEVRLTIYGQRSAYSSSERTGPFEGHDRVWLPLSAGGAQSLVHDALQLLHAAFVQRHSHILLLGTSAAWALPLVRAMRRVRIVTNIDGLEWRRDKFGGLARALLRSLERIAVRFSDAVIADNDALVPIVRNIHGIEPVMIAYGADHIALPEQRTADPSPNHLFAVARIEPENNTAMILRAAQLASAPVVFIGNWEATEYGRNLRAAFAAVPGIDLLDPIYDQRLLNLYRAGISAYVHGHSVGGTNPSLVEAIFHADRILAFDCPFNRATLDNHGAYFTSAESLAHLISQPESGLLTHEAASALRERYRWRTITQQYLQILRG